MRAEIRAADARWEILEAARRWRAAGALEADELAAIEARHPDDRRRSRPGFRLLFFLFTLFAGQAAWAFVLALVGFALAGGREIGFALFLGVAAVATAFATESATAVQKLRGFGVEEGLLALTLGFAAGSIVFLLSAAEASGRFALLLGAAAFAIVAAAAMWRWAMPLTGAIAAGALFVALYALPGARLVWIVTGAGGVVATWRASRDGRVATAHRHRADEVFVVTIAALYLAVHVAGLDLDLFGWLTRGGARASSLPAVARALAWAAMTALPAGLLVVGLRGRDRLALSLGGLLGIATAAFAADALDLGPAWLLLLAGGALAIGVALAVRRTLSIRPGRTAGGFTDRPLFEPDGGRSFLEIAAVLAAMTPSPRPRAAETGFDGEGGEFGGGGASGKF